jgi:hypothetical protein
LPNFYSFPNKGHLQITTSSNKIAWGGDVDDDDESFTSSSSSLLLSLLPLSSVSHARTPTAPTINLAIFIFII